LGKYDQLSYWSRWCRSCTASNLDNSTAERNAHDTAERIESCFGRKRHSRGVGAAGSHRNVVTDGFDTDNLGEQDLKHETVDKWHIACGNRNVKDTCRVSVAGDIFTHCQLRRRQQFLGLLNDDESSGPGGGSLDHNDPEHASCSLSGAKCHIPDNGHIARRSSTRNGELSGWDDQLGLRSSGL
jgi:hypothetical protein